MVVVRLFLLPFRLGAAALKMVVRVAGWKGVLLFKLGLLLGLLFAPGPGRELRARIRALVQGDLVSDDELTAKVTFELAHAPRTWHLPQPEVRVADGRVTLAGAVKQPDERDELARVAGAIPGVTGVDNQLVSAE